MGASIRLAENVKMIKWVVSWGYFTPTYRSYNLVTYNF